MKTQEEIEQLADQYWDKQPYNEDAFVKGYNQCQKDMVDKKYTEEDLRGAYRWGTNVRQGTSKDFNEYVDSLNKQD
jgi:hypothetical protein